MSFGVNVPFQIRFVCQGGFPDFNYVQMFFFLYNLHKTPFKCCYIGQQQGAAESNDRVGPCQKVWVWSRVCRRAGRSLEREWTPHTHESAGSFWPAARPPWASGTTADRDITTFVYKISKISAYFHHKQNNFAPNGKSVKIITWLVSIFFCPLFTDN